MDWVLKKTFPLKVPCETGILLAYIFLQANSCMFLIVCRDTQQSGIEGGRLEVLICDMLNV